MHEGNYKHKIVLHLCQSTFSILVSTASGTALGPSQPPIQWVPEALSLGVKQLGHEADRSHSSSAEVKEYVELYLHPQYTCMA
jgi:hypothetical protein